MSETAFLKCYRADLRPLWQQGHHKMAMAEGGH